MESEQDNIVEIFKKIENLINKANSLDPKSITDNSINLRNDLTVNIVLAIIDYLENIKDTLDRVCKDEKYTNDILCQKDTFATINELIDTSNNSLKNINEKFNILKYNIVKSPRASSGSPPTSTEDDAVGDGESTHDSSVAADEAENETDEDRVAGGVAEEIVGDAMEEARRLAAAAGGAVNADMNAIK